MTYEMYRYIFLGALIACGIFFAVAVVLFFTLRIPQVISDLTGRSARKGIEMIRRQNEKSGDKTYQSSAVNLQRGKLTDKISQSGRLLPRAATPFGTGAITERIPTQQLEPIGETAALDTVGETTALPSDVGETDVLSRMAGETEVLTPAERPIPIFAVEYEITFIHTNEVIA